MNAEAVYPAPAAALCENVGSHDPTTNVKSHTQVNASATLTAT
jgi:hypothetical protein